MDSSIIIRTVAPILLLMGIGYFSRRFGVLKAGDERVFSAYVYYFALPALFIVALAETSFTAQNLMFALAGILPILIATAMFILLYFILRFSKNTLYLLILSTVFGSLTFFGIPFVTFAFPDQVNLATLSAASISIVSVSISITVLEVYKLEKSTISEGAKRVAKRLSRNPLVISILIGVLLSVAKIEIPAPISSSLHTLGDTTAAVAIFMLGVFLYGRKYINLGTAVKLSLLRILLLPSIGVLIAWWFNVFDVQRAVLIVMQGVPIAISMIVLSERYDFYKETIASLILISSLLAGIYLNLWLLLLGMG
ncbi:MAG TPA: AEC family transporter [Candidatus Bathyarchaeia archaeon]